MLRPLFASRQACSFGTAVPEPKVCWAIAPDAPSVSGRRWTMLTAITLLLSSAVAIRAQNRASAQQPAGRSRLDTSPNVIPNAQGNLSFSDVRASN